VIDMSKNIQSAMRLCFSFTTFGYIRVFFFRKRNILIQNLKLIRNSAIGSKTKDKWDCWKYSHPFKLFADTSVCLIVASV